MSSSLRRHFVASGVTLALSGAAIGAVAPDRASFNDADSNGDGALSFSEAEQASGIERPLFGSADEDHDQALNRAEFHRAKRLRDQQQSTSVEGRPPAQSGAVTRATPTVQVREQPARLQVTDPRRDVVIEQTAPELALQPPPPRLETHTPDSQVEFRRAEPLLTGVEQGEPRVEIEEPGTPRVTTRQGRLQGGSQQQAAHARHRPQREIGTTAAPTGAGTLMSMQVGDLKGSEVENRNGESIGEVETIVLDPHTGTLHALVAVGGVLGFGGKRITLVLDEMQLRDDTLVALTAMNEDELDSRPAYIPSSYRQLEDGEILAQANSAGNVPAAGSASFATLDENDDNHIGRDEAQQNPALRNNWRRIDANSDQRIDRAEFNAFERIGD